MLGYVRRPNPTSRSVITLHVAFVQASCISTTANVNLGRKGLAILESSPITKPLQKRAGTKAYEQQLQEARVQYKIVIYDPSTKRQQVAVSITPNFHFVVKKGCQKAMMYMDSSNRRWTINFHSDEDLDEFCIRLALVRNAVTNCRKPPNERELIVQDVASGSEEDQMGVTVGCTIKICFKLWKIDSKHRCTLGSLIASSQKHKLHINPGDEPFTKIDMKASPSEQSGSSWIPKGMELGVLGLTKNARRVLVIPPDLAVVSDSNSYSDIDPKNAATAKTLVAFVRLLSVKHKKHSSSSDAKAKKRKERRKSKKAAAAAASTSGDAVPSAATPLPTSSPANYSPQEDGDVAPDDNVKHGQEIEVDNNEEQEEEEEKGHDDDKIGSSSIEHEDNTGSFTAKQRILNRVRRQSRSASEVSVQSIGDIMHAMKSRGDERKASTPTTSNIENDRGNDGGGAGLLALALRRAEMMGVRTQIHLDSEEEEGLGDDFETAVASLTDVRQAKETILLLSHIVANQAREQNPPMMYSKVEGVLRQFYKKVTTDMKQQAAAEGSPGRNTSGSNWKESSYKGDEVVSIVKKNLRDANEKLKTMMLNENCP